MVVATVDVGNDAKGVAVTPDGDFVYVTTDPVSVIQTSDNKVVKTVKAGQEPWGVVITSTMDLGEDDPKGGGNGSCTLSSPTASNTSFPVYLLIPVFILIARLRRKKPSKSSLVSYN